MNRFARETDIAKERIRYLFDYCAETGVFTWRVDQNYRKSGSIAGWRKPTGYRFLKVDGIVHPAHRVAWMMHTGRWPNESIDHINLDPSDCRISNLREATVSENLRNKEKQRNNSSGYKGVAAMRPNGKYQASIMHCGKAIYLGSFNSAEEAGMAYAAMSERLQGEFSRSGACLDRIAELNK